MFKHTKNRTEADLVTGVCVPGMHAAIRRPRYDVLGVGRKAALNGDTAVIHVTGEGLQENMDVTREKVHNTHSIFDEFHITGTVQQPMVKRPTAISVDLKLMVQKTLSSSFCVK